MRAALTKRFQKSVEENGVLPDLRYLTPEKHKIFGGILAGLGLSDDLALALEAESIRIDRVSGKGNVGIEIPNEVRELVTLGEIVRSRAYDELASPLALALGDHLRVGQAADGLQLVQDHRRSHHRPGQRAAADLERFGLRFGADLVRFDQDVAHFRLVLRLLRAAFEKFALRFVTSA